MNGIFVGRDDMMVSLGGEIDFLQYHVLTGMHLRGFPVRDWVEDL